MRVRIFVFLVNFSCLVLFIIVAIKGNPIARAQDINSERCQVTFEYCYIAGYGGGEEEKENGYPHNPQDYYELSVIQVTLAAVKASLWKKYQIPEQEFNSCCKSGFFKGYSDGYYGRPKMKLKYNWDK